MKKIEIKLKLKDCCLTCEHFYPDGSGLSVYSVCGCGNEKREIKCLHMPVCKMYNGAEKQTEVVSCGQCRRWCQEGAYGLDQNGEKKFYGTCDMTKLACREDHFCSYGLRNK